MTQQGQIQFPSNNIQEQPLSINRINKKLSTYAPQILPFQGEQTVQFQRKNQKHKTYTENDLKKKSSYSKYKLANITERKMLMMVAFIDRFIEEYQVKKKIESDSLQKKRKQRKIALHLTSSSQFKSIEPVSVQHMNLEQTYEFFLSLRSSIVQLFHQNFNVVNQKRRSKLIRMLSKNQILQSIEGEEKQNIISSGNGQSPKSTFITNVFDNRSLSQTIPEVDIMAVSNFPKNTSQMLEDPSKRVGKFHHLMKKSKSYLRIHPPINKYESRKKQEIRIFLQLNEKTQHLQNFRSCQGKFFKFNENLKLMVKNVNVCRIVLLNKRKVILQQLQRLEEQKVVQSSTTTSNNNNGNLFSALSSLINSAQNAKKANDFNNNYNQKRNSQQNLYHQSSNNTNFKTQTTKQNSNSNNNLFNQFLNPAAQCQSNSIPPALKQKALRIQHYFVQTQRLFAIIQEFMLQFIKKDKSYQNYIKQNSLKLKLKSYNQLKSKQTISQLKFNKFVDKCFHIAEISRLYFNALNQLKHQNIGFRQVTNLTKQDLQKFNKGLIQLRYVLIYLQKQCQNTTQSLILFKRIQNDGNRMQLISQQQSPRATFPIEKGQSVIKTDKKGDKVQKQVKSQDQNLRNSVSHQASRSTIKQNLAFPLNAILLKSLNQTVSSIPLLSSTIFLKGSSQNPKSKYWNDYKNKKSKKVDEQQKQLDMNEIWKSFYNKKFSSNAMRLRLY